MTHELQQKKAERLARAAGEGKSEASSMRDGDTVSMSSFQTDSFVRPGRLEDGRGHGEPRKSKAQLWNELKVQSLTRAFTLIYSLSLLTILTRIQLNLLGRRNYLDSVISLAQPVPPARQNSISLEDHDTDGAGGGFGNDFETNRRYLTFSWYLLHKGYARIMEEVRAAVEEVFGAISPSEAIGADRLRDLVLQVRRRVEGATEQERKAKNWLSYLLPPREEEESVLIESGVITPTPSSPGESGESGSLHVDTSTGPLRQLLDETADTIEWPAFKQINTMLLGAMFSQLIDTRVIQQSYPQPRPPSPSSSVSGSLHPRIQELDSAVTVVPAEPRVKLANLLAIITRQAHAIGNGNAPNEYLALAEKEVRELDSFACVIYTNNLDQSVKEMRPQTSGSLKSAEGIGVSDVGTEQVDEMIESQLESAWMKISGSTFSSR